jgi:hypothetical protein
MLLSLSLLLPQYAMAGLSYNEMSAARWQTLVTYPVDGVPVTHTLGEWVLINSGLFIESYWWVHAFWLSCIKSDSTSHTKCHRNAYFLGLTFKLMSPNSWARQFERSPWVFALDRSVACWVV